MSFDEQLSHAIEGLGPALGAIESVVRTEAASWIVRFENADIEIEADPSAQTLAFTSIVGFAQPADRLRVYGALLQFNLVGAEAGGLVMALNAEQAVVQTARVALPEPTAEIMAAILENLLAKIAVWRHFIAAPGGTADAPTPDSTFLIRA